MKLFFSIFFLLLMMVSTTVSVVEQWQGEDVSEVKESKTNDADDTNEEEKVEKEVYIFDHNIFTEIPEFSTGKKRKMNHYGDDAFLSEAYAFLPKLPPEA